MAYAYDQESKAKEHPFIQGLLKTLPDEGSEWPVDRRAKWLQTAANAFDLMYKSSDPQTPEISIFVLRDALADAIKAGTGMAPTPEPSPK
jgi:hypothetical protein